MHSRTSTLISITRVLIGILMFFAGLEKVTNPGWSAANFLNSAQTFHAFYAWFALPTHLWWVDPLNAWSILLIGIAMILGVFIRPAAWAGALLMLLYYFPQVVFPYVDHGYIVEEHIIYIAVFYIIASHANYDTFTLSHYIKTHAPLAYNRYIKYL